MSTNAGVSTDSQVPPCPVRLNKKRKRTPKRFKKSKCARCGEIVANMGVHRTVGCEARVQCLDCRVWRSGSESKLHDETRTRCAHCIRDICGYSMNSHIRRCHFRCQRCASIFPSRAVHDEAMSQCDLCTVKDCKIMKHKLKAHADQMSTCDTCGVRGFNLTPHYRVNPACRPKPQVTYEAQPPTSEDLKKLKKPAFAVRRCTTCLADGAARMCHACIIYPFGIRNT